MSSQTRETHKPDENSTSVNLKPFDDDAFFGEGSTSLSHNPHSPVMEAAEERLNSAGFANRVEPELFAPQTLSTDGSPLGGPAGGGKGSAPPSASLGSGSSKRSRKSTIGGTSFLNAASFIDMKAITAMSDDEFYGSIMALSGGLGGGEESVNSESLSAIRREVEDLTDMDEEQVLAYLAELNTRNEDFSESSALRSADQRKKLLKRMSVAPFAGLGGGDDDDDYEPFQMDWEEEDSEGEDDPKRTVGVTFSFPTDSSSPAAATEQNDEENDQQQQKKKKTKKSVAFAPDSKEMEWLKRQSIQYAMIQRRKSTMK